MNTINRQPDSRRVAIVPISYRLLMSLVGSMFPKGVKLVAVRDDSFAGSVEFLLESESFPEVEEGLVIPQAPLERNVLRLKEDGQ